MKIRARRKSTPVTTGQWRGATIAGLRAGGYLIANEIKRSLRGGYRSSLGNKGDFTTGTSLNHVRLGEPVVRPDRASIRVGTDLLYNLFWEVGHHNIFTRHFERDEKWGPAFNRALPSARRAFQRTFQRTLEAAHGAA